MLTNKEFEIFDMLWKSKEPLMASDIAKRENNNINTTQNVLRKLLNGGLIEVAEIKYSGTVLSRSYKPAKKAPEMIAEMFAEYYKGYIHIVPKEILVESVKRLGD